MNYPERIVFRLSKTDRAILEANAKERNVSVSHILRELTKEKYNG